VPDGTGKRALEVETTADGVRIHDGHQLVAVHALLHARPSSTPTVVSPGFA
jgi:hypothetical protein